MSRTVSAGNWKFYFTSIFLANMTMYLGMQMVDSMVSVYADYLGASATVVGLVSSLFALTALIFKVFAGPAIDCFRKKYIIIGALSVLGASFFGMSASTTISALIAFRLLQGVGRAFSATCFLALVSEIIPKKSFSTGIGIFTIAQAVSQAIGPTMGLAIAERFSYRCMFFTSTGLIILSLVLICLVRTEPGERKTFRITLNAIVAKEAAVPALMLFFLMSAYCVINSFLILYGNARGISGASTFFLVYAGTMLVSRPMIGKLTDRFGTTRVIVPALVCFMFSFVLISRASSLVFLLSAAVLSAFGYGAITPALQALCLKAVSDDRRGAASSTSYIGLDLGNLAGPVFAGALIERVGYSAMWLFLMIPAFLALVIAIAYRKRTAVIEQSF